MKRMLTTGAVMLAVLLLASAQPASAYTKVTSAPDSNCLTCHQFAGGTSSASHTTHNTQSCTACHVTAGAKDVMTAKCIVCHPNAPDTPGKCNLVNIASHQSQSANCMTCHSTCAPAECIDSDNDTYGENCDNGTDCDDTDPTIHEGCQISCDLSVVPRTFSVLRALLAPVQPFIIRAERDSDISFSNPICIYWESEGVDDILKIRIGEKLIIGFVRVWASHLTTGDFSVQVTYGDPQVTQCGPIEVKGSDDNSTSSKIIIPNPMKVQGKCF